MKKFHLKPSHIMTLDMLLDFFDLTLDNFASGTSANRRCLIRTVRQSWTCGLNLQVSDIQPLSLRSATQSSHSLNTMSVHKARA